MEDGQGGWQRWILLHESTSPARGPFILPTSALPELGESAWLPHTDSRVRPCEGECACVPVRADV